MSKRLIYWLGLALLTLLLLLGAAGAGLWWWAGTPNSLPSTLAWLRQWQPELPLQTEGATGSLRHGGKIDRLQWQQDGLTVEAHGVSLAWQPLALLDRQLQLNQVHVDRLRVDDQRAPKPKPATPEPPPESLLLPGKLAVEKLSVDQLEWAGPPALVATGLRASYHFDGQQHALQLDQLAVADGQYQGQATLQGRAPMQLAAELKASLVSPALAHQRSAQLNAVVKLAGPLAKLVLDGELAAAPAAAGATPTRGEPSPHAQLHAVLEPWAAQPVPEANADFAQLDLAMFWPEAPRTLLNGKLQATPAPAASSASPTDITAAWNFSATLDNQLPGPWDKQRLPLSTLRAEAAWRAGLVLINRLNITVPDDSNGKGRGGQIQARGQWNSQDISAWNLGLDFSNLNLAQLHSSIAAARLDGKLTAKSSLQAQHMGVDFNADLASAGKDSAAVAGFTLRQASARGRWANQTITLQQLQINTADAELKASGEGHIGQQAGRGEVSLKAPGLQLLGSGDISPTKGNGQLKLDLADANAGLRWLQKIPGMPEALKNLGLALEGGAQLQASWNGGWRDPAIDARLQVAKLNVRQPNANAPSATKQNDAAADNIIRISDTEASVRGRLSSAELQLTAKAATTAQRVALQLQGQAGQTPAGVQGVLNSFKVSAEAPLRGPGAWTLATRQAIPLQWAHGGAWRVGAGQAALTPPARIAGGNTRPALLSWDPAEGKPGQLHSVGRLEALPMAWVEAILGSSLTEAGLHSDLMLGGDWDITLAQQLRVRAQVQRTSGDIVLLGEDTSPGGAHPQIRAQIREARLTLTSDGPALRAALRWDTVNAGQVDATADTTLTQQGEQWSWPEQAPVSGQFQAKLPRIADWSALAPPGWRMRGNLEANATLSGTRAVPQLHGKLLAQNLALRSVVDGVELSDGSLQATLQGDGLNIDNFILKGAGGGDVTARGTVGWPAGKPAMDIQAQARQLRVTTRPDMRITVSGQLGAKLQDTQLRLDGALKVDSARITLPEESVPKLDNDVVVRRPGNPAAQTAELAPKGRQITPVLDIKLDVGEDFHLRGLGLNTELRGAVQLTGDGVTPKLTGAIRTHHGEYRAYGQWLDIDTGVIRFTGPYDNPALDILALRPNLTIKVGVQISGTALAPNIRIYSSPALSDTEALAWLLLGRSAAAGGAEAAMLQQAALAVVGGKQTDGGFAGRLGLDEFSVGSTTNAEGTKSGAVTLGKRFSRNFYISYEASLAGAMGTLYVFYDLSQRFTLRGQSGTNNAVDLIFTLRYD
ncbi:translocation/assembly module TamB domain-containing protein [Variovorax sp. HJSM1_2]|uniref:translocation/assembly module TamB domain-containing protein n=1 Tax=Variovorax sp. HJSM1_2 TaxID=3366263 RepID=UPI003BBFDF2F